MFENNLAGDIDYTSDKGNTALMVGAKYGNVKVVELLLNYGADPTIKNDDRKSAETLAANVQLRNMIRLVIKNKKPHGKIIDKMPIGVSEKQSNANLIEQRNKLLRQLAQIDKEINSQISTESSESTEEIVQFGNKQKIGTSSQIGLFAFPGGSESPVNQMPCLHSVKIIK